MPDRKRPQKAQRPADKNDESDRVSLDPLDPVEALKGLLATSPPPAKKPKKRPKP